MSTLRISELDAEGIPLKFSLCLPDTCSPNDFQPLIDNITSIPNSPLHGIRFTVSDHLCQTKYSGPEIDSYDVVGM